MNLQSSIEELKGLGPKSAEKFHKLDIYTIEDLLLYYPFRYEDFKSKSVLDLVDGEKGCYCWNSSNTSKCSVLWL